MKTIHAYRIASPWISLEDRKYYTRDGKAIRKTPSNKADAILILAVDDEEIEDLIDSMIRCPRCGWPILTVEQVEYEAQRHYLYRPLEEESIGPPKGMENTPCRIKARCERCRRLSDVRMCGQGLKEKDPPVIVYHVRDRSTVEYPSLSQARKEIHIIRNRAEPALEINTTKQDK